MKRLVILFWLGIVWQANCQNDDAHLISAYYPQISDTVEWSENQIIDIIKGGKVTFCEKDLLLQKNDTDFYVKKAEFLLNDSIFDSAYFISSIFFNRKSKKSMHCLYLIIYDRWGNKLELEEDALTTLPILSYYLDNKIKKMMYKHCRHNEPLAPED